MGHFCPWKSQLALIAGVTARRGSSLGIGVGVGIGVEELLKP